MCDLDAKMATPPTEMCMNSNMKTNPDARMDCMMEMIFIGLDGTCIMCENPFWKEGDSFTEYFMNSDCQSVMNTLSENWEGAQFVAMNKKVVSSAVEQMSLMREAPAAPEATGFNYDAATIGVGVGFVAGYAIMKMLSKKRDDSDFGAV